nr:hypothetical protein [Tanacetum cinerariifolium]
MTFNVLFKDDDNKNAEVHIDKEHHTSLGNNLPNNEDSVTKFKKLKKEMNTAEVALLGVARQAQLTMHFKPIHVYSNVFSFVGE